MRFHGSLALAAIGWLGIACADLSGRPSSQRKTVPGGDPERGRALVASGRYGCTACHTVSGLRGARGVVGPPLSGMADRAFIAGQLPNKPDVLIAFLQNPSSLVPKTGMPDVRLGLGQARDIAAYLYTLELEDAP